MRSPVKNTLIKSINNVKKSEKFKLLSWGIGDKRLCPVKHFYIAKLFVGNTHYRHMTILRKKRFHTFDMDFSILHARTMAHIYGHLKHSKAITLQILTEQSILFSVFLCFSRQIKKYQYPHNAILTKPIHEISVIFRDMQYAAIRH